MTERCICTALRQVVAYSTEPCDTVLEPVGIKATMFRLLRSLEGTEGISIKDLAARTSLERSTLGSNLRVLEKQNLIETEVAQDKRAGHIRLADDGRATLQAAIPLWRQLPSDLSDLIAADAIALITFWPIWRPHTYL
ncbi:MarR family winged helix-turn-helix transcriptional regulator [Roseobacter insulae]|nr:MarR family winged helix-turn-helix transcriptional regulator [Roseobacter insulae]